MNTESSKSVAEFLDINGRGYVALTDSLVVIRDSEFDHIVELTSGATITAKKWRTRLLRWILRIPWVADNFQKQLQRKAIGAHRPPPGSGVESGEAASSQGVSPSSQNRTITVEVTRRCNMDCCFCPEDAWINTRCIGCRRYPPEASRVELGTHDWVNVIMDAATLGFSTLEIRGGEALLRETLVMELLEAAKIHGISQTVLWTNGVLCTPEFADHLRERRLRPHIALQFVSSSSGDHEKFTGAKGTFETIVRNIAYMSACSTSFSLFVPHFKGNEHDRQQILESLSCLAVRDSRIQPLFIHGPETDPHTHSSQRPYSICVTWYGDVLSSACSPFTSLGNVATQGLDDILDESASFERW